MAVQKRLDAHRIYEEHFPTTHKAAKNLYCLAELYDVMGQSKKAGEKRLAAQCIHPIHFPKNIETADILTEVAD